MIDRLLERLARWLLPRVELTSIDGIRYRGTVWTFESGTHLAEIKGFPLLILRMRPPFYFWEFTDDTPAD